MSEAKQWAHLVKPLEIKDGPPGLYPRPRLWAEGGDYDGFEGNFSYGFFTGPTVCHPVEGAVVHPYDEILLFAGTDLTDLLGFDAEMSIELGEEREEHVFDIATVVCIPKGLPHGAVRVRKIGPKAIAHYHFGLAAEYQAETIPEASLPVKTSGTKYAHLLHPMRTYRSAEDMAATHANDPGLLERAKAKADPQRARDEERGVLHPRDTEGPGSADSMVCMFGREMNDMLFNFTWGFYSGVGDWGVEGDDNDRGHAHPEPEAIIWLGMNPDDLGYLGAEIELAMGPEHEWHVIDRPTFVVAPGGFLHTPLFTRRVDDPHIFMIGMLGEEYVGLPTQDPSVAGAQNRSERDAGRKEVRQILHRGLRRSEKGDASGRS